MRNGSIEGIQEKHAFDFMSYISIRHFEFLFERENIQAGDRSI